MRAARYYVLPALLPLLILGAFLLRDGVSNWVTPIWFIAGYCMGVLLLWVDEHVAFPRYHVLDGEEVDLVTRSTLFLLAYIPLSLFLLTSTGSLLGMGIIIGIGCGLAAEMLELEKSPEQFHVRYLQQLKRSFSAREITVIAKGFAAFVLGLSALLFV